MSPSGAGERAVTLETKCWEYDWQRMLTTRFLREQIERNAHPFAQRHLFINNVQDTALVARHAERLVADDVLTGFHIVDDHAKEALDFFGVSKAALGRGYVYSIAELVSVYLCKTRYLLHYAGDSILEAGAGWIDDALDQFEADPAAVVANPTWDGRFAEARSESYEERGRFFVGYGFSDQCYLARTRDFRARIYGETNALSERYPVYGGELFEKRVDAWMRNHSRTRLTHTSAWYRHLRGADGERYCAGIALQADARP